MHYFGDCTGAYPERDHKGISGNFWCCSCSNDDGKKDIILCDHCQDILSHKECMGMDENDYFECPKCKYVTNYQCTDNKMKRWSEEDVIRLIIMIDLNMGMDEMLSKLNCDFAQFSVLWKMYENRKKLNANVSSEETDSDSSLSDSDSDDDLDDDTNGVSTNNLQNVVDLLTTDEDGDSNRQRRKRKHSESDEDEDGMPLIKKQKMNGNYRDVTVETVEDVLAWFYMIGYGQYVDTLKSHFEENEVDGRTLRLLTEDHLKSFGIHRLYDRIMIVKEIKKL